MSLRTWAGRLVGGLCLLVVLALVAGSLLGQPVLLGYVETGSMAPTLEPGDGFVAVPPSLAGSVEEGDVIVYEARQLNGGGLTTHRVVGRTENGFVTRGDANPFTDQDGNEPPVTRGQIRAVALQVGGSVVVLPNLGTLATTAQGAFGAGSRAVSSQVGGSGGLQVVGAVVLGVGLLLYLTDVLRDGDRGRSRDRPSRPGADPRLLLLLLTAVMVAPLTAAMVLPSGPTEYPVVSAQTDSPAPQVVEQGTTEERRYAVHNGGAVPVVAYVEPTSEGLAAPDGRVRVGPGETANATLGLSAPPETGYYVRSVTEHRYLLVLPAGAIDALYRVHPWLPILAIDLVYGGGFYLFGRRLVGRGRVRTPPGGGRTLSGRLLGKVRRVVG